MGKVGFIGIRDAGPEGSKENTGNFLHGYAARQIIGDYTDITRLDTSQDSLERWRSEVTHLGFVAATTIPVNREPVFVKNHAAMADFIKALGLPVVVFGLGAQAPLNATVKDAWVNDSTLRLMRVLSEHSQSIAVRGAFTAELLYKYGIKNAEVVGCQSTFFSRRPNFSFPEMTPGALDRILVSITRCRPERALVRQAIARKAGFIGQSSHFEYRLREIEPGIALKDLPEDILALLPKDTETAFTTGEIPFEAYHTWIRDHFRQFYNMPDWFDYIRGRFGVAIGSRFHGNMSAMLSGVPALWVVHDSRTQEFCNHLGLPHVPLSVVRMGLPIEELVDRYLDSSRFNALYPVNYARFHAYLERQGVSHRLQAPLA